MSDLDLTTQEQANVRAALRFLRRRCNLESLSQALHFSPKTLANVSEGQPVSASLAFRLAQLTGQPMDDLLNGKYPPACPHCGQPMPPAAFQKADEYLPAT